ncbi:biosynthetic peptidoglycan transglycosylase [Thermophilibacter mediterraneus]|uniref:biosynthetic peptidoglycan transglycosylase n=1 Tax=Thermophilibacter mediterraneus TaxID=1871031 RepID=UPI002352732F|nr:biosynthetic peptidoglycan transglycosylase [Thermophilibacter mediterraneus]
MRVVLRALRRLLLVLLAVGALAAGIVTLRGYGLYHEALGRAPIEQTVDAVRAGEGYVTLAELPQTYLDAVVAIEDHRFYDHPGFDVIAICRAAWHDLTTLSLEQGGSTITQQLAKNLFFSQDKDFSRKVAEVFMAVDLEGRYSKEEILELYVNTSYFGDGLTGIGPAARGYLGKEPIDMTRDECALMAGLPNAPGVLSADPELARERALLVLGQMEKYGLG